MGSLRFLFCFGKADCEKSSSGDDSFLPPGHFTVDPSLLPLHAHLFGVCP